MGITYTFEQGFLWYRMSGHQNVEETRAGFEAAFQDPAFRPGLPVLIDARDTPGRRSASDLASLAAFFGAHRHVLGRRFALLISEKNPSPGKYSRVLVPQSDRYKVRFFVFYEPEAAIEWLTSPEATD
ncbi:MAG: hypothetical protein OZSIB_0120 [Candidatus Ozemobacter sibiricus]|jgi:hypothetical protein|uniref:STAS/SEC14 domain-containing protein n=1 Tax=Candidatus Ozemobacter sibiricus TaxID=2268124 RepID=A0A367ZNB5_9BACT|nr:MAG: hypothetical protein OZSIB_0120 [Candidatus Ozemobacter sibiricus]